jgi:ribonuclease PH
MRPVTITRRYTKHAEGSVLVCFGDTQGAVHRVGRREGAAVPAAAAARAGSPPNTACCRAPPTPAGDREAGRGNRAAVTQEIQRLIGRSLRCVFDLSGARASARSRSIATCCRPTAARAPPAITGAFVAAHDAVSWLLAQAS